MVSDFTQTAISTKRLSPTKIKKNIYHNNYVNSLSTFAQQKPLPASCAEKALVELNNNIDLYNVTHKYSNSFEFSKILIQSFPYHAEVPSIDLDEDDGSIDIFWKSKNNLLSGKIEDNLLIYAGIFGEKQIQGQELFDHNNKPETFIHLIKKYLMLLKT